MRESVKAPVTNRDGPQPVRLRPKTISEPSAFALLIGDPRPVVRPRPRVDFGHFRSPERSKVILVAKLASLDWQPIVPPMLAPAGRGRACSMSTRRIGETSIAGWRSMHHAISGTLWGCPTCSPTDRRVLARRHKVQRRA
jgi:hypothetical protein